MIASYMLISDCTELMDELSPLNSSYVGGHRLILIKNSVGYGVLLRYFSPTI
jgi:hypothetical protein